MTLNAPKIYSDVGLWPVLVRTVQLQDIAGSITVPEASGTVELTSPDQVRLHDANLDRGFVDCNSTTTTSTALAIVSPLTAAHRSCSHDRLGRDSNSNAQKHDFLLADHTLDDRINMSLCLLAESKAKKLQRVAQS